MNDKKGMSAIVTTVIMVALALVAIGIVWAVISNIIGTSAGETAITAKCLKVDLVIDSASCVGTPATCTIVVSRKAGGETTDGMKVVVSSPTITSDVMDKETALDALGSTTLTVSGGGMPSSFVVDNVKVTPYFKDDSGNKIDCAKTAEYNL
jgi:hypothetical protein